MNEHDWLAKRFEGSRGHLRGVAYRILGSVGDADDALQDSWLRLSRTDASSVDNLEAWFTTIVARVCLNKLRSRRSRNEDSLDLDGPITNEVVDRKSSSPEDETVLAESAGLALMVVLDKLAPAERVAFVLHDVFDIPFEEIASIVGRSSAATRQLASRARRRVRGTGRGVGVRLAEQLETVEAFLAALRAGDIDGILNVLDPDVLRHVDAVPPDQAAELRGAKRVAEEVLKFKDIARFARAIRVNGSTGILVAPDGRLRTVIRCTIEGRKIMRMDLVADPELVSKLDLSMFSD